MEADKKLLQAWVEPTLHKQITEYARQTHRTTPEAIRWLLERALATNPTDQPQPCEER